MSSLKQLRSSWDSVLHDDGLCLLLCRFVGRLYSRCRFRIVNVRRRTSASAGNRGVELGLGLPHAMGIDVGVADRGRRLPRI